MIVSKRGGLNFLIKVLKVNESLNLKYNPGVKAERKKPTFFCLTFLPTRGHLCLLWFF